MMRRCAFLTLAERGNFVIDDEHAYAPLREAGWRVDAIPWNQAGVRWSDYELVVIRSTWDYQSDPDLFLRVLAEIEASDALLANPRRVVQWNLRKTYLKELAARGVAIVPTAWRERLLPGELAQLFDQLACEHIVIKPQVGANADGAFRVARSASPALRAEIADFYADKPLMAQPFVTAIQSEGEYSLFYFNGEYSHAVLKTPDAGDFRCQEEHGGLIKAAVADKMLLAAGARAVAAMGEPVLYARADFVRAEGGSDYWLMELELIEPSLYLRMDPGAPLRFARAIDALADQAVHSRS